MSWKNVKEHYRIDHYVSVTSEGICIGSPYIHDLIVIGMDGVIKKRQSARVNDDLDRYTREMDADPKHLQFLVQSADTFGKSFSVFTYDGSGEIIEKKCEALGYPNVTHDGDMMYENMFSEHKEKVIAWAKNNAELGVKFALERIERIENELAEARRYWMLRHAENAKLERDYPG